MTVKVRPLRKEKSDLDLFEGPQRKGANSVLNGKMPTIYGAFDEETGEYAAVGFRYRRQSHSCELTWWIGRNEKLLKAALQGCIAQMILEGRKRAELFVEENWVELPEEPGYHYNQERGGKRFGEALERAGFTYEGHHKVYTKYLEDVDVYSWVTLIEGLPEVDEDVTIEVGRNETVDKYREKNIDLYKKDRDYYSYTSGGESGKTFAEILEEHHQWVLEHPRITVQDEWTAK